MPRLANRDSSGRRKGEGIRLGGQRQESRKGGEERRAKSSICAKRLNEQASTHPCPVLSRLSIPLPALTMQSDPAIPPSSDRKAEVHRLMAVKDSLEAQIEAAHSAAAEGQSLVDAEGYPRPDLDVHSIRNARSELARLQTDHKRTMAQIEAAMFEMHKEAKAKKLAANPNAIQAVQQVRRGDNGVPPMSNEALAPSAAAASVPAAAASSSAAASSAAAARGSSLVPFYRVNTVSPDSPAEVAGLRAGDEVLQFGSITASNKTAASMAAVVTSSVGRALPVTIRRDGTVRELRLIPQAWSGRGMLGCHLVDM